MGEKTPGVDRESLEFGNCATTNVHYLYSYDVLAVGVNRCHRSSCGRSEVELHHACVHPVVMEEMQENSVQSAGIAYNLLCVVLLHAGSSMSFYSRAGL